MSVLFHVCLCTRHMPGVIQGYEILCNWSFRWLWAAMWVLGTKPRSSAGTTSNSSPISTLQPLHCSSLKLLKLTVLRVKPQPLTMPTRHTVGFACPFYILLHICYWFLFQRWWSFRSLHVPSCSFLLYGCTLCLLLPFLWVVLFILRAC